MLCIRYRFLSFSLFRFIGSDNKRRGVKMHYILRLITDNSRVDSIPAGSLEEATEIFMNRKQMDRETSHPCRHWNSSYLW